MWKEFWPGCIVLLTTSLRLDKYFVFLSEWVWNIPAQNQSKSQWTLNVVHLDLEKIKYESLPSMRIDKKNQILTKWIYNRNSRVTKSSYREPWAIKELTSSKHLMDFLLNVLISFQVAIYGMFHLMFFFSAAHTCVMDHRTKGKPGVNHATKFHIWVGPINNPN